MSQEAEADHGLIEQAAFLVPSAPKQRKKRRKIVESPKSGSQESFEPQFNQYKKVGLQIDKKRVTTGSWALQENKIYLNFLQSYKRDFENELARRRSTVFNRLSKALRKRTPDQCRSHHQKLQNRFQNNLDTIIDFVRGKIEKQILENDEKPLKSDEGIKVTGTGLTEQEDQEPFEVDLAEVMVW